MKIPKFSFLLLAAIVTLLANPIHTSEIMPTTIPSLTVLNAFHNERLISFHKNLFPNIYLDVSLELSNTELSVPSVASVYQELELKLDLLEGETLL